VLVRAAHARRPVLTSDYGTVGAHTRRHRLGLAVDTTRAEAVAGGLAAWLESPSTLAYDADSAAAFAAANTAEAFAKTFFTSLLDPARGSEVEAASL